MGFRVIQNPNLQSPKRNGIVADLIPTKLMFSEIILKTKYKNHITQNARAIRLVFLNIPDRWPLRFYPRKPTSCFEILWGDTPDIGSISKQFIVYNIVLPLLYLVLEFLSPDWRFPGLRPFFQRSFPTLDLKFPWLWRSVLYPCKLRYMIVIFPVEHRF
jgi:hypothetical protein